MKKRRHQQNSSPTAHCGPCLCDGRNPSPSSHRSSCRRALDRKHHRTAAGSAGSSSNSDHQLARQSHWIDQNLMSAAVDLVAATTVSIAAAKVRTTSPLHPLTCIGLHDSVGSTCRDQYLECRSVPVVPVLTVRADYRRTHRRDIACAEQTEGWHTLVAFAAAVAVLAVAPFPVQS